MSALKDIVIVATACTSLLAGCQDQKPVAPIEPGGSSPPALLKGRVVQSVTGSGHITSGGELRTFTFSGRKYADGSVGGEWQLIVRAANATFHGNISCLTIVGNKAWVGGTIERGPAIYSTPPNNYSLFQVIDNGEGANAPPDQITPMAVSQPLGAIEWWCTAPDPHPLPIINIEQGNVQIRH